MDDTTRAEYEAKSQQLRADLKQWESDWASAHNGKKPGREHIKANPDIAQKYKQYNKVREILSGKAPLPAKEEQKPPKRRPEALPAQTPTKRTKHFETPSKARMTDHDDDLMNSPAISRKLFSPASVTAVGPTPQRDGRVLGLFDLLVEKELGTPPKNDSPRKKEFQRRIDATPSKRSSPFDEEKLGRTPMSSSKRQRLNNFMTPLKNKEGGLEAVTPSSVSKLQFETPSFLKRISVSVFDDDAEFDAPAPLRLPRKPMVRGLSEIVASLRKVEEEELEELDDDMDALREAEGEEVGAPKPKPAAPKPKDDVLVEDSQARRLPLGAFDDEGMYDSPVEDEVGRDGNPLPIFKKKGQKRTTRRSNMKPIRVARPENMGNPQQSDEENDENDDFVPETQKGTDDQEDDLDSDAEKPKKGKGKAKAKGKIQGTVKKAARKVNELAHANFQRLKLKNNGAKGGPGFNSRFRRRR